MLKQLYFFGNLLFFRFVYQLFYPFKYQFFSSYLDTLPYFASFPFLVVWLYCVFSEFSCCLTAQSSRSARHEAPELKFTTSLILKNKVFFATSYLLMADFL
jgi:hypothetical protein